MTIDYSGINLNLESYTAGADRGGVRHHGHLRRPLHAGTPRQKHAAGRGQHRGLCARVRSPASSTSTTSSADRNLQHAKPSTA